MIEVILQEMEQAVKTGEKLNIMKINWLNSLQNEIGKFIQCNSLPVSVPDTHCLILDAYKLYIDLKQQSIYFLTETGKGMLLCQDALIKGKCVTTVTDKGMY